MSNQKTIKDTIQQTVPKVKKRNKPEPLTAVMKVSDLNKQKLNLIKAKHRLHSLDEAISYLIENQMENEDEYE